MQNKTKYYISSTTITTTTNLPFSVYAELYNGDRRIPRQPEVFLFLKDNLFNIFMLVLDIHRTRLRSGSANDEVINITVDVINANIPMWINDCLAIISGNNISAPRYSP